MSAVNTLNIQTVGGETFNYQPGDQKPGFQSYLEKSSGKPLGYSRADFSWASAQKVGETDRTTVRLTDPKVVTVNGVDTLVHKDLFVGQFYCPMTADEAERDLFYSKTLALLSELVVREMVIRNNRPW